MRDVDRGARALHRGEHRNERQVDLGIRAHRPVVFERLGKRLLERARRRGKHAGAFLVGLHLGKGAPQIFVGERFERVVGNGRVHHVARKPHIEHLRREQLLVGDKRLLRRVRGVHPVQHLLRVERGETPLRHDLGEHRKRLVAFKGSRALRGGKRRERARVEQRRLLGLDERDAHALPFRNRALNGGMRIGPAQDGLPRKRGALGRRLLPHKVQHVGQMRVEADVFEGGRHARGVERGERRVLQVELEIDIARDGRHLSARERLVAVGLDLLLLLAFELACVLVDALEVAVGGKQLRGRLVAHAGHAGDVVGRVALKPEEIGKLGGCDTIALEDLVRAVDRDVGDALLGRDDVGELAHELVDVLITGHEQRAVPERLIARGHGA